MICKCETLNITEKNDEQILVTVMRGFEQEASENESEGTPQPFPVEISTDIDVKLTTPRAQRLPIDFTVGDEGRILIDLKADRVKTGTTYGIEVTGLVNGSRWCAIGDSVIRITRTTERGPKQVKVDADPYEVTLWAGYVGDVVPRNISELFDDIGLAKASDVVQALLDYAKAADLSALARQLQNYIPTSQKGKANGVASLDAQGKVPIAQLLTEGNGGLVLRSLLGAINGVATLDGGRLVWDDQLRMGWRGYYTGDIDATNIKPGIWGIDNRSLGAAILGDELAHGILVQFCDTQHRNYRTQLLLVGRNAQSPNGDAVEIYARRYLPGKSGWGAWLSSSNTAYTLTKTGSKIELRKNGILVSEVADSNTTYSTMSKAEAETGTATSARTMSAKVLKSAIVKHTEDKATIGFVNSSIQTATATFRGTHDSLEELQAVEGADKNDYGYVEETDADGNKIIHRYKYVEDTGWVYEYDLNSTGFTAAEWAAIKSGMTEADVEKLRALPTSEELAAELGGKMPLTRMTDELLNPDECLEPGVYENVVFPEIDYSHDLQCNEDGQELFSNDVANGTLLVSEVHSTDSSFTVQQVMIRNKGRFVVSLSQGGDLSSWSLHYNEHLAEVIVRAIRIWKIDIYHPEILPTLSLDEEGNIGSTGGSPAWTEHKVTTNIGEWVPMATFRHIKEMAATLNEKFAQKSELPSMQIVSGSAEVTIAANSRTVQAITLNDIPAGYTFGAYSSIAMNSSTGDSEGFKSCAIQFYGSTGGGTKANVALKNFSGSQVTVKVNVDVLFFKSPILE